jgi:hypothetical protein
MKAVSAIAVPGIIAATCVVALPLHLAAANSRPAAKQSTASAKSTTSVSSKQKSSEADKSGKSVATSKAAAKVQPTPNFYTAAPKSRTASAGSVSHRTSHQQAKAGSGSTVAGPNSVRRLQAPDNASSLANAPISADAPANVAPPSSSVALRKSGGIPDLSPAPAVASAPSTGRWSRLNPLSLFEKREPKLVSTGYTQTGIASWYGPDFHGGPTASGERYDMNTLTAAHPSLPFGTLVRVTNLQNGRDVIVRVNNRGPFRKNRIIDLSKEAARELGMVGSGIAKVRVDVLAAVEPIGRWGQNTLRKFAGN